MGGGPAGLYFAILMKARGGGHEVTVLERNPAGVTYGWGVVFWDDLLDELYATDPRRRMRSALLPFAGTARFWPSSIGIRSMSRAGATASAASACSTS